MAAGIQNQGLRAFARALRQGKATRAHPVEVDALLTWLTRGHEGASFLTPELGRAGEDVTLLKRSFILLDRALFDSGRLSPAAAGINAGMPESKRRARFRRLMTAFHPDRFPELSVWLTPRSQAIHQAYAAFKRQRKDPGLSSTKSPPDTHPRRHHREPWGAVTYGREAGFRETFRRRFSDVGRQPQKLILAVALLALVPILLLYVSEYSLESSRVRAGNPALDPAPSVSLRWPGASAAKDALPASPPDVGNANTALEPGQQPKTPLPESTPQSNTFPFPDMMPLRLRGRAKWEFAIAVESFEEKYFAVRELISPIQAALGLHDEQNALTSSADAAVSKPQARTLGAFLKHYIRIFEAGRLQAFLDLLADDPLENNHRGVAWFRNNYGELFERSRALDFSLDVTNAKRRGDNWLIAADFELKILYPGLRSETRRGKVRYTIKPTDGGWRIAAIEY